MSTEYFVNKFDINKQTHANKIA